MTRIQLCQDCEFPRNCGNSGCIREPVQGELIEPEQAIAISESPGMLAKCDRLELTSVAENLFTEMPENLKTQQMLQVLLNQARGGQFSELSAIAENIVRYHALAQRGGRLTLSPQKSITIAPRYFQDYRPDNRRSSLSRTTNTTVNNYYVAGDYVGGDYNAGGGNGLFDSYLAAPAQTFQPPNISVNVSPHISASTRSNAKSYSEAYAEGDGRSWLLIPLAVLALVVGVAASGD